MLVQLMVLSVQLAAACAELVVRLTLLAAQILGWLVKGACRLLRSFAPPQAHANGARADTANADTSHFDKGSARMAPSSSDEAGGPVRLRPKRPR